MYKGGSRKRGFMSDEIVDKSLEWISEVGVKSYPLFLHVFGEPLLFDKFEEHAKKFEKLAPISFSTNCTYLDERRADKLAEINWFYISLSPWSPEDLERAKILLTERNIKIALPSGVSHDWAGQSKTGPTTNKLYDCHFIHDGNAVIRWNGDIADCCIDDDDANKIGTVFQKPEEVFFKLLDICDSCHHRIKEPYWSELHA
jgi:hypothetical protein